MSYKLNMKNIQPNTAAFLLAFVFGVASLLTAWGINTETALFLTDEDGIVEDLSAIFYAMGMICCLVAIAKHRHVGYAWLWLFICLVCLGEETSWFQRWIGYSVPSVERLSAQSEFNLHNLNIVEGSPLYGGNETSHHITWQWLLSAQTLFTLGLAIYFLALPIGFLNRSIRSLLEGIAYPFPPLFFVLSMWTVLTFSFALALFSDPLTRTAVAETREMLYAFFVLLYLLTFLTE